MWDGVVRVCWSSVSFHHEHLSECTHRTTQHCAKHSSSSSDNLRDMRGACVEPLPPMSSTLPRDSIYEPRTGWLRARMDEAPCWLLKINFSSWKNMDEGQTDGRASGRADTP